MIDLANKGRADEGATWNVALSEARTAMLSQLSQASCRADFLIWKAAMAPGSMHIHEHVPSEVSGSVQSGPRANSGTLLSLPAANCVRAAETTTPGWDGSG